MCVENRIKFARAQAFFFSISITVIPTCINKSDFGNRVVWACILTFASNKKYRNRNFCSVFDSYQRFFLSCRNRVVSYNCKGDFDPIQANFYESLDIVWSATLREKVNSQKSFREKTFRTVNKREKILNKALFLPREEILIHSYFSVIKFYSWKDNWKMSVTNWRMG